MQLLAYRSLYLSVASSPQAIKSIACLSKVTQVHYPDKLAKQKKTKCWLCNRTYEHVLMLILHLEVIHPGLVEKYEVKGEAVNIVLRGRTDQKAGIGCGYVVGLVRSEATKGRKFLGYGFVSLEMAYVRGKLQARCNKILNIIVGKLEKSLIRKEQVYFHSTNIFKRIDPDAIDQDSEDDIGEVQRQLEKLRIEDFSDVNDNDKKFFIEWNGFIHHNKRKLSIIYAHDMPNLFKQFSALAYFKGIPRINLVMHAWTLWSVGQITSNDVIEGLNAYDESLKQQKQLINLTDGSRSLNNSLAVANTR